MPKASPNASSSAGHESTETSRELVIQHDIAALRALPSDGGSVSTLVGAYFMQGETIRGEARWHSLMFSPPGSGGWRTVPGGPDSGTTSAVRAFAVRDYKARLERMAP